VHTVALLELGLGLAIKVEDGASRAQYPAVVRALQLLGALPERLSPRLAELAHHRVRDTRGEIVGDIRPTES
jgi:L-asparaginase II